MVQKLVYQALFLTLTVGFTSCNGQIQKETYKEKVATSKTKITEHPRLIKTQGSLEGDNVHSNLQDKTGKLWFGPINGKLCVRTRNTGPYHFDGNTFVNFA